MDPAPGFDRWLPHDLLHLIVEEQLGLERGIYGRLAMGGNAATFSPVRSSGKRNGRADARERRRLRRRDASLAAHGDDFARSEWGTIVALHEWLAHAPDQRRQAKATDIAAHAAGVLERMEPDERSTLLGALPRLRERLDHVAVQWEALKVGETMTITWTPRTATWTPPTARSSRTATRRR